MALVGLTVIACQNCIWHEVARLLKFHNFERNYKIVNFFHSGLHLFY